MGSNRVATGDRPRNESLERNHLQAIASSRIRSAAASAQVQKYYAQLVVALQGMASLMPGQPAIVFGVPAARGAPIPNAAPRPEERAIVPYQPPPRPGNLRIISLAAMPLLPKWVSELSSDLWIAMQDSCSTCVSGMRWFAVFVFRFGFPCLLFIAIGASFAFALSALLNPALLVSFAARVLRQIPRFVLSQARATAAQLELEASLAVQEVVEAVFDSLSSPIANSTTTTRPNSVEVPANPSPNNVWLFFTGAVAFALGRRTAPGVVMGA